MNRLRSFPLPDRRDLLALVDDCAAGGGVIASLAILLLSLVAGGLGR